MYTTRNFKSKKQLKEAVAAWNAYVKATGLVSPLSVGMVTLNKLADSGAAPEAVTYYQPGPFGGNEPRNGMIVLEGPHYPEPHKWYAQATVKDGIIVAVK